MLAVEGILALDNARMGSVAQILAGSLQGGSQAKIRHRRELDGRVFQGGVLIADGAGGHDHVPGQHVQGNAAAGAHPDEGVRADVVQLLHGDGGRGAADARGAYGDLLSQQGAGVDVVLPVHADMDRVVKEACDGLAPTRVTGEEHIPPYVPFLTVNVKLHSDILHNDSPF